MSKNDWIFAVTSFTQFTLAARLIYSLIETEKIDDIFQEIGVPQRYAAARYYTNSTNYFECHILASVRGKKPKVLDPTAVNLWPVRELQDIKVRIRHF